MPLDAGGGAAIGDYEDGNERERVKERNRRGWRKRKRKRKKTGLEECLLRGLWRFIKSRFTSCVVQREKKHNGR